MPESLKASEVNSKTDPTVAKQYDTETPKAEQISDFYSIVDKQKIGLLTTIRPTLGGPVSRAMAVSKRNGPDFLFLANVNSQKFADIASSPTVQITFQNSSSQDWVSITGTATQAEHDESRVKDLYTPMMKAWFGDLGDGVHNGTYTDPRMGVIEVKAKYVAYWKATVGKLGFMKEVGLGALKGEVANTGLLRELGESDLQKMRETTE